MIKKCLFLLAFCLCLSFNTYADGEQNIRVGLYYGDSAKESVEVSIDGEKQNINVSDVDGRAEFYAQETLEVEGKEYDGYLTLIEKDGKLTVINTVELEDYLCSVVGMEMSPSFELEALKAQAVAARTYALRKLCRHENDGFDVCASVHCQAYYGTSAHDKKITQAVMETKGEALYYDDKLIDAVYSATSGGYTESAENVWGTDFPYLRAVPDEYEEEDVYGHSWEKTLTSDDATKMMKEKGFDVGFVTDIQIEEATENGAVTKLTVTGTEGEHTFKRESCRNIFASVTLSQAYDITPVTKEPMLYSTSGKIDITSLYLLSFDEALKYTNRPLYLLTADGVYKKDKEENVSYIFKGRGYGHLVGMSQNGANGMAKNDFTYDEILLHYYQGAEIK